jgi:hypothetical protein
VRFAGASVAISAFDDLDLNPLLITVEVRKRSFMTATAAQSGARYVDAQTVMTLPGRRCEKMQLEYAAPQDPSGRGYRATLSRISAAEQSPAETI